MREHSLLDIGTSEVEVGWLEIRAGVQVAPDVVNRALEIVFEMINRHERLGMVNDMPRRFELIQA
ncbi:MAG TPA: hypothetical protein VKB84_04505 [Candidatus Binataceae bacterium]|nr:hypothetical protein [Candidatus Binataceae bacterium]